MSGTRGAQPGTEYRPQWMKTPSLASSYQTGTRWAPTDSQVPSYTVIVFSHVRHPNATPGVQCKHGLQQSRHRGRPTRG